MRNSIFLLQQLRPADLPARPTNSSGGLPVVSSLSLRSESAREWVEFGFSPLSRCCRRSPSRTRCPSRTDASLDRFHREFSLDEFSTDSTLNRNEWRSFSIRRRPAICNRAWERRATGLDTRTSAFSSSCVWPVLDASSSSSSSLESFLSVRSVPLEYREFLRNFALIVECRGSNRKRSGNVRFHR